MINILKLLEKMLENSESMNSDSDLDVLPLPEWLAVKAALELSLAAVRQLAHCP